MPRVTRERVSPYLASSGRKVLVDGDRLERLRARHELRAVEPVLDRPRAAAAPLKDVAAGVHEGPHVAGLGVGDDLKDLDVLDDGVVVVDDLLRGDDAVAHREDGDGAVRLAAPDLHGGRGLLEAGDGVDAGGAAELGDEEGALAALGRCGHDVRRAEEHAAVVHGHARPGDDDLALNLSNLSFDRVSRLSA